MRDIDDLASAAGESGLPAIVAKRAGSAYRAGVSKDWLRIPVRATSALSAVSAKAKPARAERAAPAAPAAPPMVITHPRKV